MSAKKVTMFRCLFCVCVCVCVFLQLLILLHTMLQTNPDPMMTETHRRPRSFSESLHIMTSPSLLCGSPSPTRIVKVSARPCELGVFFLSLCPSPPPPHFSHILNHLPSSIYRMRQAVLLALYLLCTGSFACFVQAVLLALYRQFCLLCTGSFACFCCVSYIAYLICPFNVSIIVTWVR